jgi:hypothetical protein
MKWYSSYSTAIHFSWHSFRFEEIIWTTKNINHSTDGKFLNNLYSLLYTMIRRSTSTPSPVWMLHIGWTLFDRHDYYFTSIIGWTLFDSHDWRWTPGFHRQLYFPCRNPRVKHVILPYKISSQEAVMKPSWLKTRKNLEQLWVRSRWLRYRWRIQCSSCFSLCTRMDFFTWSFDTCTGQS